MQELGISADIAITMLTMPLEITGSASYKNMQMNYKDTKSYSESIVYATGTSHLSQSMCTPNVELADKLVDAGATHVVVGITYGARCNVKYEQSYTDYKDETEISGMLDLKGTFSAVKIDAHAEFDMKNKIKQRGEQVQLEYTGDIPGPDGTSPDDVEAFLKDF